ncbi:hypothetical protein GOARA_045_00110 [Gordonia araii NBRC 100433]|uniref:Uncharacterized protein n=1 Tax=Gordonia araii NBRC 100433 TaxID=1073574 RepID=G7H1D2_9ACTN|nr:hypothetical protein [Gordonia araii]NNG97835.1 hypothetical protein [Gordonia araii NBRC 100433]GAB09657.1 hypothetical protein GOARA_045_00110 [Gordonia araii NBRC 100433]
MCRYTVRALGTSDRLHDVQGWEGIRAKEKQLVWVYVFFGVIAVAALVVGVDAAVHTRYLAAACFVAAAGAAVALLAMTSIVLVFRRRTSPRLERDTSGSFLVDSGRSHVGAWAFFYLLSAIAAGLAAVGIATGRIDYDSASAMSRVVAWSTPVLAVLATTTVVYYFLGFIRFPRVEATAKTLSIGGYRARETAAWTDIAAIDAMLHKNNAGIALRLVDDARADVDVFFPGPFAPTPDRSMTVPLDVYATGTLPLLTLLRFYLDHPEARSELEDGSAHRRLRDGEI